MIALIIIGDEILSSQIKDKNLAYMLENLSINGFKISEVRIIQDDLSQIESTFKELSKKSELVISSGGVGPTHDDKTLEGVALAFKEKLLMNDYLKERLENYFGQEINSDILKMAKIPENAEVIPGKKEWPIIKIKNCFILPGVPEIFRKKFDRVLTLLPQQKKYFYASVYLKKEESYFINFLKIIQKNYSEIAVGSYPVVQNADYKTQITLKSKNIKKIEQCFSEISDFFEEKNWICKKIQPEIYHP